MTSGSAIFWTTSILHCAHSQKNPDRISKLMQSFKALSQYELFVVGEAASNISKEVREKYPEVPWKDICGLRNKLAHQYFGVDLEIIWRTASKRLPPLRIQIEQILQAEFPDQNPV